MFVNVVLEQYVIWSILSVLLCNDSSLPFLFFFFNDTATTEIYTLSLHDALPIYGRPGPRNGHAVVWHLIGPQTGVALTDRKSTRLNSSHLVISYAVFCLKKKKLTATFAKIAFASFTLFSRWRHRA